MERIDTVYGAVVSALEQQPEARSSDKRLVLEVYKAMGINVCMPFSEVLQSDAPSIATIERCRRKAQARNPQLAAVSKVEGYRAQRQEEFKGFSVENGVQ